MQTDKLKIAAHKARLLVQEIRDAQSEVSPPDDCVGAEKSARLMAWHGMSSVVSDAETTARSLEIILNHLDF
jgi:hypothetical protein